MKNYLLGIVSILALLAVGGGAYYGPSGIFEARGYPKKAKIDDRARDADVAARLWKVSEEMTGVKYDQLDKNVI